MTSDVPPATAALAAWAAEVDRRETLAPREAIVAALRDVLGCMLAGQSEPEPERLAQRFARWGSGPATVLGTAHRLPAPWAAMVNGVAAHVLDYDDSFAPLTGHACASLVPAILALAEERGASGADVADAFVVGLEIICRIALAANPRHYALGWHSTATIGVIGAAAACARLLRLPAGPMGHAISLGVSMASGTRMQLGAAAKSLHAGLAAKGGVLAATLAADGFDGAEEALVGPWRFMSMYAGGDAAIVPPAPGEPLAITSPGFIFKPYPTCGSTHRSLNAIIALREAHGIAPEAIERIETVMPAVNRRNLMYPNPRTGREARFSMEYCGAVAAMFGRVTPLDFVGTAIDRPAIRAMMTRIDMRDLPGSEDGREDYLSLPAITTITLKDGQVLSDTRYGRRGSPEQPLSEAEQVAKFSDCAAGCLPREALEMALDRIARLNSLGDVRDLTSALAPVACS